MNTPQLQALCDAHNAVITTLREGARVHLADGHPWYDTRPLLDLRERSPEGVDRATAAIDYAITVGLAVRDTDQPHLVRLVNDD